MTTLDRAARLAQRLIAQGWGLGPACLEAANRFDVYDVTLVWSAVRRRMKGHELLQRD